MRQLSVVTHSLWLAPLGSIMKVPPRIFIVTVLPASPRVFLSTRQRIWVLLIFHKPSTSEHEFSKLPDSLASCRLISRPSPWSHCLRLTCETRITTT